MKAKRKQRFPDAGTGKERTVSYGYVGRYASGDLGWMCPDYLNGNKRETDSLTEEQRTIWRYHDPQPFELCRITVEVIPGARRRWVRAPSGERGKEGGKS